ncbi:AANH-like superfamily protein [Rhizobium phaseoli]|nr:hypothetical protein [Rhizobium phaseoli]ANL66260.1 AANH-like superfamily protein [Rhizobium phaseoli]ANL79073.1 AANH-like superfamily protein [Rhizobium phaseoli]ANM04788.1 AANH-like superfamily protein [Rhizobium phaseoli]
MTRIVKTATANRKAISHSAKSFERRLTITKESPIACLLLLAVHGCSVASFIDTPSSLYSADLVNFNEGRVAYNHHDADDFIRLNGLASKLGSAQWKMTRLTWQRPT